jgi:ferredoxin
VYVDLELCESNGVCVGIAPKVFELGGDDCLSVLEGDVPPGTEAAVEDAVRLCPKQAIRLG